MAKSDNLGDFLTGIAEKLRALLGTGEEIPAQEFEGKIQAVRDAAYTAGFADGGPEGITAQAGDVLAGKVFGSGGNGKATGTMPQLSSPAAGKWGYGGGWLTLENTTRGCVPAGTVYRCAAQSVASLIGLNGSKLAAGQTVLGISGTSEKLLVCGTILAMEQYSHVDAHYITQTTYNPGGLSVGYEHNFEHNKDDNGGGNAWARITVKESGSYKAVAHGGDCSIARNSAVWLGGGTVVTFHVYNGGTSYALLRA